MLMAAFLWVEINQISPSLFRLLVTVLVLILFVFLFRAGVFFPRHFRLRRKGLDLLLAGNPTGAESCYRTALELNAFAGPDRVRLLVCLGDALIDQGRYLDAKQYLTAALGIGDPTGSGQESMCDLLLGMKTEPEKAIAMADEALRLSSTHSTNQDLGIGWEIVRGNLHEAKCWALKTRALLLLDRQIEARQAMDRALRMLDSTKELAARSMPETSALGSILLGGRLRNLKMLVIANAHWEIALALLAMRDKSKAAEHLQIVRSADRLGKYQRLAEGQLRELGFNIG